MRILHVITTIDLGGAENQLIELCREQITQGHSVTVIFLKGRKYFANLLKLHRIGVEVNPFSNFNNVEQLIKMQKLLRGSQFDIIHAHLPRAEILCRLTVAHETFVITRHNSEAFWPNQNKIFSRILSLWVLSRCNHLISISDSVKNYLKKLGEIPNLCENSVVHYGISPNPRVNRMKRIFQEDSPIKLLAVGRLVKQKNYELMFRSLADVPSLDFELTICGEGDLENRLKDLAKRLGIFEKITWKGKVENIAIEYESHDVLLHTSSYEGFGFIYLEAMSFDLPILTSNNTAALEILGSNYFGFFENGIQSSLSTKLNSLKTARFKDQWTNSYENILRNFTSESMYKKTIAVYRKAQKNNASRLLNKEVPN